MKLSKRLNAIKDFVDIKSNLVDIGTDHAFIPIQLMLENKINKAIAMDINKGPLEKAKNNIILNKLEDKIEIRLSDGFEGLKENEADTALIAGMGADLMIDILKRGEKFKYTIKEYILSPHSQWDKIRRFLRENKYLIIKEKMVFDENKYYLIIKASFLKSDEIRSEKKYDLYGKYLIDRNDIILKEYLIKEKKQKYRILKTLMKNDTGIALKRMEIINAELSLIEEVLDEMQKNSCKS